MGSQPETQSSPATEREPLCIIGIARCCNRIVFASVESPEPERRKEQAREVAKMIRAGYRIETWTCEQVRNGNWCCDCPKEKRNVEPTA